MNKRLLTILFLMSGILLKIPACRAATYSYQGHLSERQTEQLDRGLMATAITGNKAFLSWRLLLSDKPNQAFELYKQDKEGHYKLIFEAGPKEGCNFTDKDYDAGTDCSYWIKALGLTHENPEAGSRYTLKAGRAGMNYISISLQTLPGHVPGDCSTGDLDGDGQYEIIVKQEMRPRDNSHDGFTGQTKLEAYSLDGEFLWRIDLGKNIREGAHYTQFMVYDLDGDGKAEIACKTADGTKDGQGKVLGDSTADWRSKAETGPLPFNPNSGRRFQGQGGGHLLSGPEYLTIFDGQTGAELVTVPYEPPRHPSTLFPDKAQLKAIWSDGDGNRADRYLACIAYLDGQRPSLVMCRGYYSRSVLAAWDYREGKLQQRWIFDSHDPKHPENRAYAGQGNHNLSVADVDQDGFDEIVYGNMVVDHNGKGLYTTGIGHADAMHLSDLDPERFGLEVFNTQEPVGDYGMNFRNAGSGEIYWNIPTDRETVARERKVQGPGRAVAFDIDPRYRGAECWVFGGGISGLYNCKGEKISERTPSSCNFAVWWDGDLLRELLDRNYVAKYNWEKDQLETLFVAENCISNNGTKATPALSADLFGDWREEIIFRTTDNKELRIYSTQIPSPHRMVTLMQDPLYRLGVAWQNVAYNIPPHLSRFLE
ncbi:MAG: rhamnogalacturonan lyase [Bacteroidales bacterium]|nr:rhamnogalacturonan lyase [Bacteroidales bacterium]